MHKTGTLSRGLLLATALVAGLLAAIYAVNANGARTSRVVMTAKNKTLGKTILVNRQGMTLYFLSVERKGHFICSNKACVALWKPLTVAKGVKPTGAAGLSTVKRPDGSMQVAYKGHPLYRFVNDHKRGAVTGNGFKDVGTWTVAVVGKAKASSPPPPASTPTYTYPSYP